MEGALLLQHQLPDQLQKFGLLGVGRGTGKGYSKRVGVVIYFPWGVEFKFRF